MSGEHLAEVDGAEDVHVVKKEWFRCVFFQEKPGSFFQATAGIKKKIVLAGDFDADVETILGTEETNNFFGVMMHVDDEFRDAEFLKPFDGDFEKGAAVQFDEGFGDDVSEWAEAGAQTCGENHGFHGLFTHFLELDVTEFDADAAARA